MSTESGPEEFGGTEMNAEEVIANLSERSRKRLLRKIDEVEATLTEEENIDFARIILNQEEE